MHNLWYEQRKDGFKIITAEQAKEKLYAECKPEEFKRRKKYEQDIEYKINTAIQNKSNEAAISVVESDVQYTVDMLEYFGYTIVKFLISKGTDIFNNENQYLIRFSF